MNITTNINTNKTYKIRIFSSFCPSENCKEIYERLCEVSNMENYGKDKDIYITNEDDYSHVIILNTAMPEIKKDIPKKNVIGFAFEPPQFLKITPKFIEYAKNNIGKYFIGEKNDLGEPFIERYSHMWHNPPLKSEPQKNKIMSLMISEKVSEEGHLYRHCLLTKIIESKLPIDIYGRGCKFYLWMKDERIKGEFKELEPYENYLYHISIENCRLNHYFSEKIMNPLLCNTTPIYMGCNNIEKYFPNTIIPLSGELEEDFKILKDICNNPEVYIKTIDVDKIKNRIFLLRNLDELYD